MAAELAVETGLDPVRLLELGDGWMATLVDVIADRAKRMEK